MGYGITIRQVRTPSHGEGDVVSWSLSLEVVELQHIAMSFGHSATSSGKPGSSSKGRNDLWWEETLELELDGLGTNHT